VTEPWRVYIRDPQLRRVALLEDYTSLTMTIRFNDVSTWQLTLSARSDWASTLAQDAYGIQVYRGSQYILSGMWSKQAYTWDDNTDQITFFGEDENAWFKRRLALPNPTIPDTFGTWTTSLEDATSGAASSALAFIVQRNLGVNAQPHRRVTAVADSSATLGPTISVSARWQNLLTFCQETATAGVATGLEPGFRIIQDGLDLRLQVYRPTDRTDSIKFSPALRNVGSITYERTAPEATAVYVGGSGDGAARTYIVKTSPELSVWGRREADLANASSTNVLADLTLEADKVLAEKAPKQSLSVSPLDIENMRYGVDYFVGDKVSAVLNQYGPGGALKPGDAITDVLREAQLKITAEGTEVVTTVGQNGTGYKLFKLIGWVRNLATRLVDVERR
jgi:hypothetical protein